MKKEELVMKELWDLFNKKIWLDTYRMKDSLKAYKPSEIHCIEYIGENQYPNVTKLADSFYMTRSAISKIAKKLIEKGLIESYQKPENKKEIYFQLTSKGKEVYAIHAALHDEFQQRDQSVFAQTTQAQFDAMLEFAKRYNDHLDKEIEKLGVHLQSENYDTL